MSKEMSSSHITSTFTFPDAPDTMPTTEYVTPRFFHQHGVQGILRVDVPATQPCDIVKITLQASDPHHDFFQFNRYGLPPSMHASGVPHACSDESTRALLEVVYELKAHVYRHDLLVSTVTQPIQVFPSASSVPPPIAVDDHREVYAMTCARTLRKLFSKAETLEINLTEPEPVLLHTDEQCAFHRIPIYWKLSHCAQGLPLLCAKMTWRLKSTTIVSTIPLQATNSSQQLTLCPSSVEVVHASSEKSTDLNLTGWVARPGNLNGRIWELTNSVWLTIPQPKDAVPSCFGPLVTRRYSLELSLKVHERWEDIARVPTQFRMNDKDKQNDEERRLILASSTTFGLTSAIKPAKFTLTSSTTHVVIAFTMAAIELALRVNGRE
ncbi:hypothetical protein M436DRAFT_68409 [Aureobasidium namibiae CBS 147.97]|uniref:Uncharacterized protein n=1 Tax=Aureobasidium namibiae CBS 147.97 TaxID=1043004 RepID=A0A074W5P4_9PEZI